MDYEDKSRVWRTSSGFGIWKKILLSEEKLGSDGKTFRKTLDSVDFHVKGEGGKDIKRANLKNWMEHAIVTLWLGVLCLSFEARLKIFSTVSNTV